MKPHIRLRDGLWECRLRPRGRAIYGYSPLHAYREWQRLTGGAYA